MPAPKAGFDFAQFDTAKFDETPETANFTTKMEAEFNEPIFRFVYDGRIYDDFVIDAPTISRGADIIAGTTNITLSNTPKATLHSTGIAFVDSGPDTITDSNSGFITAGFEVGDEITVSGSTSNDGTYVIGGVVAGTLTLIASNSLTNENAGDLVTILSEAAFNFFVSDRINTIGKPCHIGMYFDGTVGYLYLMTGTVEEASFNGATVTLSVRDRMAPMLEKRIGSGQEPADYYTSRNPFNPATIVWYLLTQWGELDNTFTTANTDINFAGWEAWFDRCAANNYEVRARFPGTTIQNALLRIGDMTNSFIWEDGEGFFQFTMFEKSYTADGSDETFDTDNCVSIDLDIDKSTVKNIMNIYYGHDPDENYKPAATIGSRRIGFANDNPDRIIINGGGFLAAGFDVNDPIRVIGSEKNDGKYGIETVTDAVLTLFESNGLTDEDSGASVTLAQNQDTSTLQTTSLVFNDTGGNDTITDVIGRFVISGITANDDITISGSTSNDGTYVVGSVTANTIMLDAAETLTQEPSGAVVTLTQIKSITVTATTIAFNDDEIGDSFRGFVPANVDHINKSDGGLLTAGFQPQYQVTVSGSNSNDGTYRLANVTEVQLDLLHQTLTDENVGTEDDDRFINITQAHTLATSGKQFDSFTSDFSEPSIEVFGAIPLTDEDKTVWHDNILSAGSAASEKLLIYSKPQYKARIDATMVGFLSDIGDIIHVTEPQKGMNDQTHFIKQVDIDIDNGRANIVTERGN